MYQDPTPDQFSAPDPAETALSVPADHADIAAFSTAYTQTVIEGSQAVQDQVTADFPETVSNTLQED